jgi:AsmA protein
VRRSLKICTHTALVIVAVSLLTFIALALYARTGSFRHLMQGVISKGLGMQVELAGPLRIGLIPSPSVTLHDISIVSRGVDAGTIGEVVVRFRWGPLLHGDPDPADITVKDPHILIKKGTDGTLDVIGDAPPSKHPRAHGPIQISVTGANIRYEDPKGRNPIEGDGCDLAAHDIQSAKPDGRRLLLLVTFSGADLSCKAVKAGKFTGTDLKLHAEEKVGGAVDLQPITLNAFGTQASGGFRVRLTGDNGDDESYSAVLKVPDVQVGQILQDYGFKRFADGKVALSGTLAYQGRSHKDLIKSVTGDLLFRGDSVTVYGYDLDKLLKDFEKTQKFDLADFLGMFVGNGAGVVATKGSDYLRLLKYKGGVSHIHVLVAKVKVQDGIVTAQDVAASTDTHRIVAKGAVNLLKDDFEHVTLALVDAKGCAIAQDNMEGPIKQPKMQKPYLRILAGPIKHLTNKAEDLFTKKGCPVFYDGEVKPF